MAEVTDKSLDAANGPVSEGGAHGGGAQGGAHKGIRFWLIIVSICLSLFLGAFEMTAVSTALPTIVESIPGFPSSDFVWVGSAYALAGAAFLPMSGSLAEIFGRRPIMQVALVLFGAGSAMCGAAGSQTTLITGRTIQGMGGGGLISLTNIILADLVPLRDRGVYNGLIGITWSIASAIGPVVGGALAASGHWPWLFYFTLPVTGIVFIFVTSFLRLPTPTTSFREKVSMFDSIGMFLIIASSCSCIIALSWGGITFAWNSVQVILPMCLGVCGIICFTYYEGRISKHPVVPSRLLSNRTTVSGYIQAFLIQAVAVSFIYYMPVYFQACKEASPTGSGVDLLGFAVTLSGISIAGGITIAIFKCYRPQLWTGWVLTIIGLGFISTLKSTHSLPTSIGFEALAGAGMGTTYMATYFPILAPLPVESNALAIAFGAFLRSFSQVWGIAICGSVLQNELLNSLPAEFLHLLPDTQALAYGGILGVRSLPTPLKDVVQEAFATSLRKVWLALLGMSAAGLVVSLFMRSHPLHGKLDEKWRVSVDGEPTPKDSEKQDLARSSHSSNSVN